jgi:glycosidase
LPIDKNYKAINVETELEDKFSILNTYKQLIKLRKENFILAEGDICFECAGNNDIIAYTRFNNEHKILIILNFSSFKKKFENKLLKNANILFSTNNKRENSNNNKIELTAFEGSVFICEKE